MDKEYGYIFAVIGTAFGAEIIKSLGKPENVTFEYYQECRERIEELALS